MLKYYFKKAKSEGWAIGQFNFTTIEQLKAIINASLEMKSPVILGTSGGESLFFGVNEAALIVSFYKRKYKVPIFLNLDHGRDYRPVKSAVDAGYDMVHFDGSKMNLNDNMKKTIRVVKYARAKGVLVEGEVGYISGKSSLHQKKAVLRKTDITLFDEAIDFAKKTEVDLLAVSVGGVHGVYSKMPSIDFSLLKKITTKTKPFSVFHGSSGFSSNDMKKVIESGVAKINVNTDLRIVWRQSLEKSLRSNKKEYAPYNILESSKNAVFEKVKEKINLFGSKGKAKKD